MYIQKKNKNKNSLITWEMKKKHWMESRIIVDDSIDIKKKKEKEMLNSRHTFVRLLFLSASLNTYETRSRNYYNQHVVHNTKLPAIHDNFKVSCRQSCRIMNRCQLAYPRRNVGAAFSWNSMTSNYNDSINDCTANKNILCSTRLPRASGHFRTD